MNRYLPWLLGLAFMWGLSEATVFFIVPDVIISLIALKYGLRQGFFAVVAAIIGAIVGGALVYCWGKSDIASARAYFDALPAIAPSTIARAKSEIGEPLFGLAMLKGSLTGVPFKLYASEAGAAGTSFWMFVAMTPLVRLPRFLLAAILASVARRWAPPAMIGHGLKLLGLFWCVFYAIYWMNAAW